MPAWAARRGLFVRQLTVNRLAISCPGERPTIRKEATVRMSDHKPGDEQHRHESPLLHAQEHKGFGDDEGEREELLEGEEDEETEAAD